MVMLDIKQLAGGKRAPNSEAPDTGVEPSRKAQILPFVERAGTSFPFAARFAVLNLIGLALVAAAWAEDLLFKPYTADHSGMSYLITVLFLAGLVAVARRDWQTVRWSGNALVYLGMVGTVLGLIMTVSELSTDKAQSFDNFKTIVAAIYIGSGTALYTNLLACIGYLWLGTNAHLLARQEI
ncbi:MAG: hypothetical protein QOK29_1665 [Rhodospirillaceae bacterium]|jgi:NADH:ubiquinone oxidoreductase subunit 2 (subunit N)|nr:hypothetical protein [Rhodospirillaceae bacterium]